MGTIWRGVPAGPAGLPNDFIYRLRSSRGYVAFHENLKYRWAPAFFALLFVYLGLCLASHLLYNVQDVAGFTCTESADPKPLEKKESRSVEFTTSALCNPTGIMLEANARYTVTIAQGAPWTDNGISVPLGGFSPLKQPVWYHRILLGFAVPLRREITQDWFRIVLRYGRVGGEEDFIVPDPDDYVLESPIKPTRNGELFIFVNDAVLGIPRLYDLFYRGNKGSATLTITRK
jgi:hypothetical protein